MKSRVVAPSDERGEAARREREDMAIAMNEYIVRYYIAMMRSRGEREREKRPGRNGLLSDGFRASFPCDIYQSYACEARIESSERAKVVRNLSPKPEFLLVPATILGSMCLI